MGLECFRFLYASAKKKQTISSTLMALDSRLTIRTLNKP